MILLLGATSYIGQGFARALRRRKDSFIPLSRNAFDYTRFEFLFDYVRKVKPDLLINAAECVEKPTGESVQLDRTEMLQINTLLPQTIARICALTKTAFGHVSSGHIYSGAKVIENGSLRIQGDLGAPSAHNLLASDPDRICGFSESDKPNSCFNSASSTFYSGTKALAEEALRDMQVYIWRLCLPFNELDDPNNFLSQLQDGFKIHDTINSLSHLDQCIGACLELWDRRAPLGTYNVANPGPVRIQEIVQMIQRLVKPAPRLQLIDYETDSGQKNQRFPHSDCVLDVSKLLQTGVNLLPARQALEQALQRWTANPASPLKVLA